MFSTDTMQYGSFEMEFPRSADFEGPYPVCCGYRAARTPFSLGRDGGLLVYVLRGEGAATRAGVSSNYFAGCILAATLAQELVIYPAEETEYLYLLLRNAENLIGRVDKQVAWDASRGRADRMMGRICHNASVRREDGIYAVSADVYALLMELCALGEPERAFYSPLVRQVMELMREEFAFLTGVDELAERMGVTASHLSRCFSEAVGVSPIKYLQSLKLDNAKLLLQGREHSIDMIADMVGYSGANYFCKVFRRETGESPGQYRARQPAEMVGSETRRRLDELEKKAHL